MFTEKTVQDKCAAVEGLDPHVVNKTMRAVSEDLRSAMREMVTREFKVSFYPRKED